MLRKMEEKGLVSHTEQGRQFVYRAEVDPELVQNNLVGDLVTRLFDGDPLALVNHLLRAGQIELGELDELRQQVAKAEQKQRKERS
jgi:predicted transcriptional regulator